MVRRARVWVASTKAATKAADAFAQAKSRAVISDERFECGLEGDHTRMRLAAHTRGTAHRAHRSVEDARIRYARSGEQRPLASPRPSSASVLIIADTILCRGAHRHSGARTLGEMSSSFKPPDQWGCDAAGREHTFPITHAPPHGKGGCRGSHSDDWRYRQYRRASCIK